MNYKSLRAFCNFKKYCIVYTQENVRCNKCGTVQDEDKEVYYCHPVVMQDEQDRELRFIHCVECMQGVGFCPITHPVHSDERGILRICDNQDQAIKLERALNLRNKEEDPCVGNCI